MLVSLGAAQYFRALYNQASAGVMPPATFSGTAVMTLTKYAQVTYKSLDLCSNVYFHLNISFLLKFSVTSIATDGKFSVTLPKQ